MSPSPPLRFLAIVLGGWAALRTALVVAPWSTPPADAAAATLPGRPMPALREGREAREASPSRPAQATGRAGGAAAAGPATNRPRPAPNSARGTASNALEARNRQPAVRPATESPLLAPVAPLRGSGPARRSPGRWSLSAWTFVRQGASAPLAAGGLLGGSQAGVRLAYRLNRDPGRALALALRLSAPPERPAGAEAALGVDWKPARRFPVHVLAERRQAIGPEGRSAFAVSVHGGVGDVRLGPFRVDGYGQAGMVGTRSRDPFADGSLRLSLPLDGRARVGAGAWAAAQPGLSRLDLGPQAAFRLPVAGRAVTVTADWRVRIAGNARPGSGPTLTLATDF